MLNVCSAGGDFGSAILDVESFGNAEILSQFMLCYCKMLNMYIAFLPVRGEYIGLLPMKAPPYVHSELSGDSKLLFWMY